MRPRGPNPQPGTKPENFVSSNGVRMGRGAADDRDRMDRQGQGGPLERAFVQSATNVLSPSNRLSPRPTLLSAGKSPQILRQQSALCEDSVRSSPGDIPRQQQSPAPIRSRVVESGFHSTNERSRPPSPAPSRQSDHLPECRTPLQQNRMGSGPFTPSSAPTMARAQPLPTRQPLNSTAKQSQPASGTQLLSNTALVAQRFGAGGGAGAPNQGAKPSTWTAGGGNATPRLMNNGATSRPQSTGVGAPDSLAAMKRLSSAGGALTPMPTTPMSAMQRNTLSRPAGLGLSIGTSQGLGGGGLPRPTLFGSTPRPSSGEMNGQRPK